MMKSLIVDDEEMGRTVLEEIFCKYGQYTSASTGLDAIKMFQTALDEDKPFDLIILDISLEDITGLEVLKKIKAIENTKGIEKKNQSKVIMATSDSKKEMVMDCIKSGCKGYFIKPVKMETVADKLEQFGFKPIENSDAK